VNVIKDRTGKFQDRMIEKPGQEFGGELLAWLQNDALPEQQPRPTANGSDRDALQAAAIRKLKEVGVTTAGLNAMLSDLGGEGCKRIGQLADDVLIRLAKGGAKPETVERWNGNPPSFPEPKATVRRIEPVTAPVLSGVHHPASHEDVAAEAIDEEPMLWAGGDE
jgi:hypothetical protein